MKHLLLIFILLPVYVMCQNINEAHAEKHIIYIDQNGNITPFNKPMPISEYDTVIYQQVNYDTLWQCDREVDTISLPLYIDTLKNRKLQLLDTTVTQKDSYKEYINYILYFYYDIDYYEDVDLFVMIKPKNYLYD